MLSVEERTHNKGGAVGGATINGREICVHLLSHSSPS
jgi:hypothetical protein